MKIENTKNSFSLVELLVVIAVLAVLSTVVIIALNPFEFAKQARDARRLSELQTINTSLGVYQTGGGIYLGSSNTVYVSVPSATSTCSDLGLPSLPSGWAYHCVSSSTLTKVDGTGWISVDFTSGSYGPGLEKLPIDPINTTSSRNYYTYTPGGSWELAASFESDKYKLGGGGDKTSKDGGSYPDLYETGNNLTLLPVDYGDSALVGYWKFDEGIGTTGYDASGKGNTGTMYSGASTADIHTSLGCKLGTGCASFNGSTNYIDLGSATILRVTKNFTWELWYKPNELGRQQMFIQRGNDMVFVEQTSDNKFYWFIANDSWGWVGRNYNIGSLATGNWYHIVGVYDSASVKLYVNGVLIGSDTGAAFGTDAGRSDYNLVLGSATWVGNPSPTYVANGLMDNVRIYNRALSAAEISAIYNAAR